VLAADPIGPRTLPVGSLLYVRVRFDTSPSPLPPPFFPSSALRLSQSSDCPSPLVELYRNFRQINFLPMWVFFPSPSSFLPFPLPPLEESSFCQTDAFIRGTSRPGLGSYPEILPHICVAPFPFLYPLEFSESPAYLTAGGTSVQAFKELPPSLFFLLASPSFLRNPRFTYPGAIKRP